jgi:leucyl aminopeptidase
MTRWPGVVWREEFGAHNDRFRPRQGQGTGYSGLATTMKTLLPPESAIRVTVRPQAPAEAAFTRADAAVVWIDLGTAPAKALSALPQSARLKALYTAEVAAGEEAPLLQMRLPNRRQTLLLVGFAKPGAPAFDRLTLAGKLAKEAVRPGVQKLQLHCVGTREEPARVAALEALLAAVLAHAAPMPEWKTKPTAPAALESIEIAAAPAPEFDRSVAIAAGNHLARWLATLPPNRLDTHGYRDALQQLARREGWTLQFYDEAALEKLGAGAFLAVARANPHRDAGIAHLAYRPKKATNGDAASLALVGKGICYDTGGINLKPHKSMYLMHGDMQGSAVAVGTLLALSRLKAPSPIDCWLAITENQIGPTAYRPQDVVQASNGVTIQVVHSDAEGRMALADTLALASRKKPAFLLDFATLTGSCVVALSDRYSGAFTNRPQLQEWLQRIGRECGERIWCLPMDEDFDVELDSKVADVLQCLPDSKGDHILAARFLSRFVDAAVPWVHVDLAAAEHKDGLAHVPTEFTGFGVRYAVHLLDDPAALTARLQAQA